MKKFSGTNTTSKNDKKESHSISNKPLKNMPTEPLPQPKDYEEIEY
ncbi:hypothetical protein [Heyndrickxia camelliae]|nr:hypothetical protein [Heyndrickxia camelliae]